jgi:hypothetical protein
VRQFISRSASFRSGHHQAAAAQAGQIVGQGLSRNPQLFGKFRRISRRTMQVEEYLRAGGIGERVTESGQRIGVRERSHGGMVHQSLY